MNETIEQRFDCIYNETYDSTLKYVVSKCDNLSNVEDIMQNIYVKLFKIISKNKNYVDNYKSFLIKLSKNELFKYYSIKNKMKIILNISIKEELSIFDNIKDEKINIEEDIIKYVSLENIWKFIKRQDILTQKIITLYYMEDIKIKEIAKQLDLSESTVKTKMYRTIQKLNNEFGEREDKNE